MTLTTLLVVSVPVSARAQLHYSPYQACTTQGCSDPPPEYDCVAVGDSEGAPDRLIWSSAGVWMPADRTGRPITNYNWGTYDIAHPGRYVRSSYDCTVAHHSSRTTTQIMRPQGTTRYYFGRAASGAGFTPLFVYENGAVRRLARTPADMPAPSPPPAGSR